MALSCFSMKLGRSQRRWLMSRRAALGPVVTLSTVIADLASFGGHVDLLRVVSFGAAGLLSAVAVLLTSADFKKGVSYWA